MKQNRGFREFLLRGKRKTGIEFVMMCTVHNIKKTTDFITREGENLKHMLKMIVGKEVKAGIKSEFERE